MPRRPNRRPTAGAGTRRASAFRRSTAASRFRILGIVGSFAIELFLARPDPAGVALGLLPNPAIVRNPEMLYIAVGILGATVMPHNLYLHSSIVQTRKYGDTIDSKRQAVRFATIDSTVALMFALFLNGAILVMAAAVFHRTPHESVADLSDANCCWRRCSGPSSRASFSRSRCCCRART